MGNILAQNLKARLQLALDGSKYKYNFATHGYKSLDYQRAMQENKHQQKIMQYMQTVLQPTSTKIKSEIQQNIDSSATASTQNHQQIFNLSLCDIQNKPSSKENVNLNQEQSYKWQSLRVFAQNNIKSCTKITLFNPYYAKITQRNTLSGQRSSKINKQIIIDLEDSGIKYQVGDDLGVIPLNHPQEVDQILSSLSLSGEEKIKMQRTSEEMDLGTFLTAKADIRNLQRSLMQITCEKQSDKHKKDELSAILNNADTRQPLIHMKEFYLTEWIQSNPGVRFTAQDLADSLKMLCPRLYSIISSQNVVGEKQCQLMVVPLSYDHHGRNVLGVASNFLSYQAPLKQNITPIYHSPSRHFHLPTDKNRDIIMIGPGCGMGPYVGFMQERLFQNAQGMNWLFTGGRTQDNDFYFSEFWNSLVNQKRLKLSLAFSRDQDYKIYVQNRLYENRAEVFKWIQNGAIIYVCGDAQTMAKDVDKMLLKIIEEEGKLQSDQAIQYMDNIKREDRYLKSVFTIR